MKKFRVLCLAIILAFVGVMFSSCKKDEVIFSENITLSEETVELSYGESIDVFINISPENSTFKQFEIVGEYLDVADIECDFENMKLVITARDFVTADITEALIGVRTLDSKKEAHLVISIVEEHQNVDMPQNIAYDGNGIVWSAVDGAKNYTIQINEQEFTWAQNNFPLDLDEYAGQTINVRVKANGKSSNLDSDFTDIVAFKILERPKNLVYSNQTKMLTWNAVDDAESYTVQINNRQFVANDTQMQIGDYLAEAGQYQIKVCANTNVAGDILNSAFSNSLIITKLAAPKDPSIQNGIVIWNTVIGATAYEVRYTYSKNGVQSTEVFTTTSTMFSLPKEIDTGTYSLKIRSIGNEKTTLTSEFGVERNYTKLSPIQNLRVENGDVVWDANQDATSYTIYFENIVTEGGNKMTDSVSLSSGADVVKYNISNYPAGEYRIDVVANGLSDKISSEKTGNPITVIKLASPKNFQINKVAGKSIVQWDIVENASGYRLVLNNFEDGGTNYQTNQVEITQGLVVGQNSAKVMAIGGSQSSGVWYINSDYSDSISCVKLASPTISMSDAVNGNIMWTSSNSQGFESYTVVIKTASGDFVDEQIISQNKFNLDNLMEGDYTITVRSNAKANVNYFNSDFCEEVKFHKFGVEVMSVQNGTIQDFEGSQDDNYDYRYFVSNRMAPINSINSYVETTLASGLKISVYAKKVPVRTLFDDVYYVSSNVSNILYIQKLSTINDMSMTNGVLHYGAEYDGLSGFEFNLVVNENETINNLTNAFYDFSGYNPGDYSVKINAVSVQTGDGVVSSEESPLFINSYTSQNAFTFKKLGSPESFKITNCVSDRDVSALALLDALDRFNENSSGAIAWQGVSFASEYELNFDDGALIIKTSKSYESLQNSSIPAGVHSVKIRAIGNGSNVISGEYASNDGNIVNLSFTKFVSPNQLIIQDGKISWSYANSADDPNKDLNEISLFNIQNNALFKDGSGVAMYFLVDASKKVYSTIDISDLDFTSGGMQDVIDNMNILISRLKSNQCDLPEGIVGTATLKIFAVPLNAYISDAMNFVASAYSENKRFVMSDYSVALNLVGLETPLDFKVENKVVSWSGLRYNVENVNKPLKEYEITIKFMNETYSFVVREDSTKNYEIDANNKIIWINDLSNSDNCYWNFNKQNFEAFFGENSYLPGNYSISIRPIANNSTSFIGDDGKLYYYCNGYASNSASVEVLANPALRVENGVVVWDPIKNIQSYHLYISQTPNISESDEYIELDNNQKSFELGPYYPAGTYYFNIVAIGEDGEVFTAEFEPESERTFVKLDVVSGLIIENGIVKYSASSVVENQGNNTHYTMHIRQNGQDEDADKISNNEKYTSFELGQEFAGGKQYLIRVQANGDSVQYLNSDLSDYFKTANSTYPTKLTSPVKAYISNGIVYWTAVPYSTKYKLSISGQDTSINTINVFYDISNIEAGTYTIGVKAIGDDDYLNSDATEKTNVIKLANISELQMKDGYIVWKNDLNSNYVANINGLDVFISQSQAFVLSGYVYFALDGYADGQYSIYLYNYGGDNAISSAKTSTYTFTKLNSVSNLEISFDENENQDCLLFDTIENATKYFINVTATFAGRDDFSTQIKQINELDIISGKVVFDDIVTFVKSELLKRGITNSVVSYKISILAVGTTQDVESLNTNDALYVLSNVSSTLVVTKPAKTTVTPIYNSNNKFTGKFIWDAVENADYYRVYVNVEGALFDYDAELAVDDQHEGYYVYKTTKTYSNLKTNGTYSIIVVACQNKDSYNSDDSNLVEVIYEMFGVGENGSSSPYQISTLEQFNAIQYNLFAKYELINDLEISTENYPLDTIGTSSQKFVGEFNGNNNTIVLSIKSSDTKFVGLFAYVGENGVVKNFNINADIHSIAQSNGIISVASVACYNYGTIENVSVSGIISTEYNSNSATIYNAGVACYNYGTISKALCTATILPKNNAGYVYAGGIADINYGTIELSGFTGSATAQMVGGITAQSLNGIIDQCYYQGNDSLILSQNNGSSHNYAGGLVGYMQNGKIISSYVNGKVTGSTNGLSSNNTAYVGGLVGYVASIDTNNGEGLQGCYVVGYANGNVANIQISATGTYAYAGVFVGDNKTDCSVDGLICLAANTQSFVGNPRSSFENAQVVSNIKNSQAALGESASNFVADGNYLKLKEAKYN